MRLILILSIVLLPLTVMMEMLIITMMTMTILKRVRLTAQAIRLPENILCPVMVFGND